MILSDHYVFGPAHILKSITLQSFDILGLFGKCRSPAGEKVKKHYHRLHTYQLTELICVKGIQNCLFRPPSFSILRTDGPCKMLTFQAPHDPRVFHLTSIHPTLLSTLLGQSSSWELQQNPPLNVAFSRTEKQDKGCAILTLIGVTSEMSPCEVHNSFVRCPGSWCIWACLISWRASPSSRVIIYVWQKTFDLKSEK